MAAGYIDRVNEPSDDCVVVIVGMPGSGKTTVGEILALRDARPFVDLDEAIESSAGCTIAELFDRVGEAGFRELESVVLADAITKHPGAVLAGGGGIVVSPDNRRLLQQQRVRTVWLRARPATLGQRVGNGHGRPLLEDDPIAAIARLQTERDPLYREVADLVVEVDDRDVGSVVDAVAEGLAG